MCYYLVFFLFSFLFNIKQYSLLNPVKTTTYSSCCVFIALAGVDDQIFFKTDQMTSSLSRGSIVYSTANIQCQQRYVKHKKMYFA